jgi:hypothetical protein
MVSTELEEDGHLVLVKKCLQILYTSALPQGSPLGPLLLNLDAYINDVIGSLSVDHLPRI